MSAATFEVPASNPSWHSMRDRRERFAAGAAGGSPFRTGVVRTRQGLGFIFINLARCRCRRGRPRHTSRADDALCKNLGLNCKAVETIRRTKACRRSKPVAEGRPVDCTRLLPSRILFRARFISPVTSWLAHGFYERMCGSSTRRRKDPRNAPREKRSRRRASRRGRCGEGSRWTIAAPTPYARLREGTRTAIRANARDFYPRRSRERRLSASAACRLSAA